MTMQLDKASIYTDLAGLQSIKKLPKDDSDEALRAVAKQFESIFVNMMMKSMRQANEVFEKGGLNDTNESKFYRDMFDQQLSLSLSSGKGLGLADALFRQLKQSQGGTETPSMTDKASVSEGVKATPHLSKVNPFTEATVSKPQPEPHKSFASPEEFVKHLYPKVEAAARQLGADARYLLSQAALETGWGNHMITRQDGSNSFNLFGIKADASWQGDVARVSTLEYRDGIAQRETANFRAYQSYEESVQDYIHFLQSNGRYQKALSVAGDGAQYVEELQKAGYATDPAYADKIRNIANRNLQAVLTQSDAG